MYLYNDMAFVILHLIESNSSQFGQIRVCTFLHYVPYLLPHMVLYIPPQVHKLSIFEFLVSWAIIPICCAFTHL